MQNGQSNPRGLNRRTWLHGAGSGFAAIALQGLLDADQRARGESETSFFTGTPPKARRVIQLFMNGGVSQMDTFDYKPTLEKRHGEQVDFGIKSAVTSAVGKIMKSPFKFRQFGRSGRWVSDVFPNMAGHVDEMAFLMAMASKTNVHGPASYMQNTGFLSPGFPSMGSWISYALGSIRDNLPAFVVIPDHRGLPYNNGGNFTSAFLQAAHQGLVIKPNSPIPIANLKPPASAKHINAASESDGLKLLETLNRKHQEGRAGDSRLEARIASYELAAKMQLSAPQVLDISQETKATLRMYGMEDKTTAPFGRSCLTARRMLEQGVRFVQVWSGMGGPKNNWDNHSDIHSELPSIARMVDQPIAALLTDLKRRGMLKDTLVVWTTEFGRMPFTQGATGRDHNGGTFVTWLAGGGIRAGASIGESDEFSYQAAVDKTYCYDLHATILHLLGIDHERLTVRRNGIDRRLTDVHGKVLTQIL